MSYELTVPLGGIKTTKMDATELDEVKLWTGVIS